MLASTIRYLHCPRRTKAKVACEGPLGLMAREQASRPEAEDIRTGQLQCRKCRARYPILAGVAVVVDDVRGYLLAHAKGISRLVPDAEIPSEHLREYRMAKAELHQEHIEDDLEAERVTALYVMNHYLRADRGSAEKDGEWWKPRKGDAEAGDDGSAVIDALIRAHWDRGPKAWVEDFVRRLYSRAPKPGALGAVELGCGVGGLCVSLRPYLGSYLGVDSSFSSIALARHLALGASYRGQVRIPSDLLDGPVSRAIRVPGPAMSGAGADFVVGDIERPPLVRGAFDLSIALNAIDMLEDPTSLPRAQRDLLRPGGFAIQTCPYIWHERIARGLRARLPRGVRGSARAAAWLYEEAGFELVSEERHVPWLFFKHLRQLEVYDVHAFAARAK